MRKKLYQRHGWSIFNKIGHKIKYLQARGLIDKLHKGGDNMKMASKILIFSVLTEL